jgi:hypothetical protein
MTFKKPINIINGNFSHVHVKVIKHERDNQ